MAAPRFIARQQRAEASLRAAESALEAAQAEEYGAYTTYEQSHDRYDLFRLRAARRQIERANASIDRARPWFELALDDGTVARWHGADGPSACREFVARYGGPTVVGWREVRSHLLPPRVK